MESFWKLPALTKVLAAGAAAYGAMKLIDGAHSTLFPPASLKGEVVLITGAGMGIGRLLACKLARDGCRLALWDLNMEKLKETKALILQENPLASVELYQVDVSSYDTVSTTAARVFEEFGHVDILINNAGIVTGQKIWDVPENLARKTMDVNAIAHFWMAKAFLPNMLERNHGHLVSVASAAGLAGAPGLADYCASKSACIGFHEAVRMEIRKLGKTGVSTTLVCPYAINTGMFTGWSTKFPLLLPILEPDDVADTIIRNIKAGGHNWVIMPKMLNAVPFAKAILPVSLCDQLSEILGVADSMNHFEQTRTITTPEKQKFEEQREASMA